MKNKKVKKIAFPLLVCLVIVLAIWGPEALAKYKDRDILGETYVENVEEAGEGYRYTLNANEKLYILSCCLSSQTIPESELNALTRTETEEVDYQNLEGRIYSVLRESDGKDMVVIYISNEKAIKKLGQNYSISANEALCAQLMELLGSNNVKIVEKNIEKIR